MLLLIIQHNVGQPSRFDLHNTFNILPFTITKIKRQKLLMTKKHQKNK